LPRAYQATFEGPYTYLGYFAEASYDVFPSERLRPRVVARIQVEGSEPSFDWPRTRFVNAGLGGRLGYQWTPVISIIGGGLLTYDIREDVGAGDLTNENSRFNGRLQAGLRGDFGRWAAEMIYEEALLSRRGAILLEKEGALPFLPDYLQKNILLAVKYKLFQKPAAN
jgi:hypothetical protein